MTENHLTYFKIQNFRRFETFEMNNIGQFNLLVGDNNVGKTSVLEALLLTEDLQASLYYLVFALKNRDYTFTNFNLNILEPYFHKNKPAINYTLRKGNIDTSLTLSVVPTETLSKDEQQALILKNVGTAPASFTFVLEDNLSHHKDFEILKPSNDQSYIPFIKFNLAYGTDLFNFYTANVQSSKQVKNDLIKKLELLIPNIENIEISASPNSIPTFLISLKDFDTPIKINDFGDGSIKFLRYLLELLECKNQRLMLDEIDTGIHYSRMKDFWKTVLIAAKENNVQLFATTHSKECIQYYKEAVEETSFQTISRIFSLEEMPNKSVKAYNYTYESFANALENNLEIRGN